jgi:hypothetical protein
MQFCWLCGADYVNINRDGNTAHAKDCRYHTANILDPHNYHPDVHGRYMLGPVGIQGGVQPAAADGA